MRVFFTNPNAGEHKRRTTGYRGYQYAAVI